LQYYDEEIWTKMTDTMCRKKKINNIYRAATFYEAMLKLNKDPDTPMFKKLDKKIETFA